METHRTNLVLLCPSAAVDHTGESAVPPRELDGYLDSLFDPVLACGDAVGSKGMSAGGRLDVCTRDTVHFLRKH